MFFAAPGKLIRTGLEFENTIFGESLILKIFNIEEKSKEKAFWAISFYPEKEAMGDKNGHFRIYSNVFHSAWKS